MENPLVSVNMIAYNAEKYISQSIESVINQIYRNWELIIIDDGSSDETLSIANSYAINDVRIKVSANGLNEGIVYSRNRAVHYSQGKYIAVLDSDDIALPERLEKQVCFMESNSEFGLIGSAFYFIDSEGNDIGKGELNAMVTHFPAILMFDNFFLHSSVLMKSELAKKYLYRPLLKGFSPCEEYHLYVDIAKNNKVWNLPDYLVKYREHGGGISKTRMDMIEKYRNIVIENQLSSLGIKPSEDELKIHKMVKNSFEGLTLMDISKIKSWIKLLVKKNRRINAYPIGFEEYLLRRFWEICKLNANHGLQLWWIFFNSGLSGIGEISKEDRKFLFNRCKYEQMKIWGLKK